MRLSPTGDPVRTRARATTQNALMRTAARPNQKAEPLSIHPIAWLITELLRAFSSLASIFCPLPAANAAQSRSTQVQTAMFASVHNTAPTTNATSALPQMAIAAIGTPNKYASTSAYPTASAPLRAPPLEVDGSDSTTQRYSVTPRGTSPTASPPNALPGQCRLLRDNLPAGEHGRVRQRSGMTPERSRPMLSRWCSH